MPFARSAPECRLYIDLHPCSCSGNGVELDHFLRTGENGEMLAVYRGPCTRCGEQREFIFELADELPPPPPAFGGPAPSQIICPGQFALHAAQRASSVPDSDWISQSPQARSRAVATLGEAVAAYDEILKFIPDNADAVPESAFTSPEGHALYAAEPARFRRPRLQAVRDTLQATFPLRSGHVSYAASGSTCCSHCSGLV